MIAPYSVAVLQVSGFLPAPPTWDPVFGLASRALGLFHLLDLAGALGYVISYSLPLFTLPTSDQESAVIFVFALTPGFSETLRAGAMLLLAYFSKQNISIVLSERLPGMFALQAFMTFCNFLPIVIDPADTVIVPSSSNSTIGSSTTGVRWASLYFQIACFALSQQVLVVAMVSAVAFRSFFLQHNREISDLAATVENETHSVDSLNKIIESFQSRELALAQLIGEFSSCFGAILCVSFVMDQATELGMLAEIVGHTPTDTGRWISYVTHVILFAIYSIVLFWPFVQVHEESKRTGILCYKMVLAVLRNFPAESTDCKMYEALKRYYAECADGEIVISGAGLLTLTRPFLAGALTFALSFGVLAYEVVQKSLNQECQFKNGFCIRRQ
ncbi:hypothetical protein BV898_17468 [Hypsibius exemplaris]|uniref:Uncharacterized protein n=1 Tax=Hypsibius exemplaris TaxID=2072580 RepID=A0A9X6RML0_HYPEX|nr:hypothetical protein BV898_17468 [Hypsibius exemplaris]